MNEDKTASSSRIFIKILVQEMAEAMGMVALKRRFNTDNPHGDDAKLLPLRLYLVLPGSRGGQPDHHRQQEPSMRDWFKGMFPKAMHGTHGTPSTSSLALGWDRSQKACANS